MWEVRIVVDFISADLLRSHLATDDWWALYNAISKHTNVEDIDIATTARKQPSTSTTNPKHVEKIQGPQEDNTCNLQFTKVEQWSIHWSINWFEIQASKSWSFLAVSVFQSQLRKRTLDLYLAKYTSHVNRTSFNIWYCLAHNICFESYLQGFCSIHIKHILCWQCKSHSFCIEKLHAKLKCLVQMRIVALYCV